MIFFFFFCYILYYLAKNIPFTTYIVVIRCVAFSVV